MQVKVQSSALAIGQGRPYGPEQGQVGMQLQHRRIEGRGPETRFVM